MIKYLKRATKIAKKKVIDRLINEGTSNGQTDLMIIKVTLKKKKQFA